MIPFAIMPNGTHEMLAPHLARDIPGSDYVPIEPRPEIVEAIEDGIRNPSQLDHYLKCRANGCARKLAVVLAMRSFPGVKTDAVFTEGWWSGQDTGHVPAHDKWLRDQAAAAGVSTNGKRYLAGLASYPGDPTAWVGDRSDVMRVAREKNLTVHGYVEHAGRETDPGGDLDIDPAILDREVNEYMSLGSGERREDVAERLKASLTGQVDGHAALGVDDSDYSEPIGEAA